MTENLGEIIYEARAKMNLTRDQYGAKFNVSGPAVFKFEKGYVKPSLELWLKMAADAGLSQRRAVLLLVRSKLPTEFQEFIELQDEKAANTEAENAKKKGKVPDYSKFVSPEQIREVFQKDKSIPKGLRELLEDEKIWTDFKPTGHEINMLRDKFGPLGKGSKTTFREALRLIREFAHSF